ncbi:3053_t:CDS:2 [Ambispora gerdemannii]|uniref:Gluconokinase n=1 Tax=Ambispora gerdemannii TaxID=144530 RepID=A0A9N9C2P2_9GLOM|nr:3053_t:CDS:2 [Ambispora gerdemannii]
MAHIPVFIVMGPSASGKTSIGTLLAQKLGFPFLDGDDLQPKSNIEKMSSGQPLTDDERFPWLQVVLDTFTQWITPNTTTTMKINTDSSSLASPKGIIVACSALKRSYRDFLRNNVPPNSRAQVWFVYLKTSRQELEKRVRERKGHFMKAGMLQSQLAILEPPIINSSSPNDSKEELEERVLVVEANKSQEEVVQEILRNIENLLATQNLML